MLTLSIGVVAVAALTLTGATAASAADATAPLPNSKPVWLDRARHLGAAAASASVDARVYLAPKGGIDALKALATAVSTPGSAAYGHWLTPDQFHARFDAPASSVAAVRAYLTSRGLRVTDVDGANRYIAFSGDVASANRAFSTAIQRYQRTDQTVQAPATGLAMPASIAALVSGVSGLDTSTRLAKPAASTPAPPPTGFRNAHPCSLSFGQIAAKYKADFKTPLPKFQGRTLPYAVCGYTGVQFRSAYEGATALDGTGATVGIVDAYASPTIAADANTYATRHGDGAYGRGQLTQVTPGSYRNQDACGPSGWFGEETLDVEAVHAMAPGANVRYYAAKSCFDDDLIGALDTIVDQDEVQVVSNSYGEPEAGEDTGSITGFEQAFLQGATEGIGFTFSSGDDGDELANTGQLQADYPASDPYVTGVGGTATDIDADGLLAGQTGWGTAKYSLSSNGQSWTLASAFQYGAGGGASALFDKPSYQSSVPGAYRQVPDVAMDADPTTGMLVGETQTFSDGVYYDEYRIGGTSLASPLFAGMTALAVQKAGHGAGMLNPTVYANRADFTDVVGDPIGKGNVRIDFANGENASGGLLYSVRTFDQDSSLTVQPGYDDVTGVGSANAGWLTALK